MHKVLTFVTYIDPAVTTRTTYSFGDVNLNLGGGFKYFSCSPRSLGKILILTTLLETNITPFNDTFESMIFRFFRWDMLV